MNRKARAAATVAFATNGALPASLLARYAEVQEILGLDAGTFGLVIAGFMVGAACAFQIPALILRRLGSGRTTSFGTFGFAVMLVVGCVGVGVGKPWLFLVGLLVAGFLDAVVDVAQNSQGLQVQEQYVDNRPWFSAPAEDVDVAALAEAVRTGNRLRVNYRRNGESAAQKRIIDPYGLLGRGGRWYLILDRDRQPRQYAVERLSDWEVLDEPRRLRPGETLETVVGALAQSLEKPRETVTVTAELDSGSVDMARRITGSRLVSVEEGEGFSTLTVAYEQIGGVRQLLQFGDHIRVTEPEEARELVAQLATKIVKRHSIKDADLT